MTCLQATSVQAIADPNAGFPPQADDFEPFGVRYRHGAAGPARLDEAAPGPVDVADVDVPFPAEWRAKSGDRVEDQFVRLRMIGPVDAPAVFVLGGISAGRAAADSRGDKGWWRDLVGQDAAIDVNRFRVISADYFPVAPGAPLGVCPDDYAEVFRYALRRAGVTRLHAAVGGSFGGMVLSALAAQAPDFVGRLAVLSAAHRPSAIGRAWRHVQRGVIGLGLETGATAEAVALARQLAVTTYRTPDEFNARFAAPGAVESYLDHQGDKFTDAMGPERYLTLSAAIDRHDVNPADIAAPTLTIAFDSDQIINLDDAKTFAAGIAGPSSLHVLPSAFGHDAFLKEAEAIAPLLTSFLEENLS